MPALDRITVRGYKSIRDATVELRALNVLIGANGAGKSNFVGLLRFVHDIVEGQLRQSVARQGGANNLLHYGTAETDVISIQLVLDARIYEVRLLPDDIGSLFFEMEGVDGPAGWTALGGRFDESFLGSLGEHAKLAARSAQISDVDQALRSLRVYHFQDTSADAKVKQPGALNDNEALREDAANLSAFLYLLRERHEAHYRQIVALVRRVVPGFNDFILRPNPLNPNSIQLEWREEASDFPFLAAHLSDGSLRFICLATLLLQPEPPSTIVIDEPELGLHPAAIGLLAGMMRVAAQRTQIIVATQSPALVNEFEPEDVITVDRVDGATTFTRHSTDELAAWLDRYSLAELWEKNVIGGTP